jgi:hypothetical protein
MLLESVTAASSFCFLSESTVEIDAVVTCCHPVCGIRMTRQIMEWLHRYIMFKLDGLNIKFNGFDAERSFFECGLH